MKKITIIDGNSLFFRAYYATAYPGVEIMRSQDGTPTNAIFSFSNMINKILSDIKEGEAFMVAFDTGKPTFRKKELESYKANRKPAPEELVKQFPLSRQFLKALGVYQFEQDGFEGDDIAGTVATLAKKEGYEVHLYTSDRDFLQLVDDSIYVHILKKGLSDVAIMTPEKVKEEWGFEPKKIIDYKGLRGDSSDNLPGIPGVGEKTAVKLIQEYGDFDTIVANADNIKGKIGEAIKENAEIGRISRDLAIILTDIELPFTIDDLIYHGYEFKEINEFCQRYGLKQFISKVTPKWKRKDENVIEEIKPMKVTSLKGYSKPEKLGIALDFESEDYTNSLIYGIGLSFEDNHLYLSFEDAQKDNVLLDWLKDTNVKKYCYDFKAIKVALALQNIEINSCQFDLLIASYLIDSSIKNNPDVVMNIFGIDLVGNGDDTVSLFSQENVERTCKIAYYSKFLAKKALSTLSEMQMNELYYNLEIPLVTTLSEMEIEGFPVDEKVLNEFGEDFKKKITSISEEIYSLAGEQFNISSPKQIGEILFNKLGLKGNRKMSTSFDALKELIDEHPIVSKILEYRKYTKLLSTYIDGLKAHIHEDGKIHAKFNQALTATGRLSSSDPNLQNISIRDEEGKMIRKAFYYPNHEYEILSLDYSQIELRVLASLSNCEGLLEIFKSGEDIHSATAKKVFNLSSEPTDNQRRRAKTVNFGIVYGISDWGLADQLEIPVREAKKIISSFYSSFPEIATFFQQIVTNALKDGYVSTLMGRRRYLRELHDSNYQTREFAKRAAMNAPIQGSAADLIKIAMIKVNNALKEGSYKTKMVLQIHDELIFKVPKEEKDEVYKLIKDIMESALELKIPLEVDGGFGLDWYSAK
ncbi:MAG: DNA polymerase I [Bacilli bacterium]|nr:DNA polymerase I [Bacilli bacterium]